MHKFLIMSGILDFYIKFLGDAVSVSGNCQLWVNPRKMRRFYFVSGCLVVQAA